MIIPRRQKSVLMFLVLGIFICGASAFPQGQPNLVPGTPGQEPARIQPVAPNIPPDFRPDRPEKSPAGRNALDPIRARKEAQELAALASQIPTDMQLVTNHILPKDLAVRLKRIEKLAKNLRGELSQVPAR